MKNREIKINLSENLFCQIMLASYWIDLQDASDYFNCLKKQAKIHSYIKNGEFDFEACAKDMQDFTNTKSIILE